MNGKCTRDGLSVFFVGGFPVTKALVVFTGQGNGTDLRAIAAAGALCGVYIAGLLGDEGFEVPFRSFNFINFSACDQIDVEMPADLDQYGGDDSHGAVIGGERFVQLRHDTADGG